MKGVTVFLTHPHLFTGNAISVFKTNDFLKYVVEYTFFFWWNEKKTIPLHIIT